MIKCPTNKRIYTTLEQAEEALIGSHTTFDFSVGLGPVAVYRCEDCGYYHLTSKGVMNEKLRQALQDGSINRKKTADAWEKKLKHKR